MKAIKTILTALATGMATVTSIDCLANNGQKYTTASNYINEAQNNVILNDLYEKTKYINKLTKVTSELYVKLLSMSTEDARSIVIDSGTNNYEASEMFIRALEIIAKNAVEENIDNNIIRGDIVNYWKSIAKARYEITRLNHFVKQLTVLPKIFDSKINFDALKDLSDYTTEKMINDKYTSI